MPALNQVHVMLDLETLSTAPDAAIVQIGAVRFSSSGVEAESAFHVNVEFESAMQHGHVDGATLVWWLERPDIVRQGLRTPKPVELRIALLMLSAWLPDSVLLWSHKSFDLPILISAHRATGQTSLLRDYHGYRDLRTLEHLCGPVERAEPEIAHRASHDAIAQATTAARLLAKWEAMKGGKP